MSIEQLEKLVELKEKGVLTEEEFQAKKTELLNAGESRVSSQTVELWNPSAAANWSVLFSPIFGAFLQAQNWKALSDVKKSKSAMLWVYLGCLVTFLVVVIPGLQNYGGGIGILWFLVWYFSASKAQTKYVKEQLNNSYVKKGWVKPVLIAIGVVFLVVLVAGVIQSVANSSHSPNVSMVKNGSLYSCPNHTVEEMVNGFMGSPSWESGTAEDGTEFVNINGDIMYMNKQVRSSVQFIVNKTNSSFEFGAIEMNNVPQSRLIANALLKKMCESAANK